MPPRRSPLDKAIDTAVGTAMDALFERGAEMVGRIRDNNVRALPPDRTSFVCAGCRKTLAIEHVEMIHPSNGYAMCKACFSFTWNAGKEKMAVLAKRAAANAAARVQGQAPPPPVAVPDPPKRRSPYDVLGIDINSSLDDIRKAFRKKAADCHPDTVPVGASADERAAAAVRYEEVDRAYKVLVKLRKTEPA